MKFTNLFRFEKKEIDQTFQNSSLIGKISAFKLLKAPIAKNNQEFGKLLIIASRKVGKAHKRNKVRRRLKSIFYQEQLYIHKNNYIILAYKPATELKFEQIKNFLIKSIKSNV